MEVGKLSEEDAATLRNGKCPVCGSEKFFQGPQGGLASNILCENGHKFWVAGPFNPEYLGQEKVKVVSTPEGETLERSL